MIENNQQYPVLNCKKISKAKTTSLKLFDEKEQIPIPTNKITRQSNDKPHSLQQANRFGIDFSYLDQQKSKIVKEKSFEEIMNDTRKFLALKKKMEEQEKIRNEPKKDKKSRKLLRKQQKQGKIKSNESKKKSEKQIQVKQEIILTALDIQKFSTESESIRKILEKITWLEDLKQKCNIISPLLFKVAKQEKDQQKQKDLIDQKVCIYENKQFLLNLQSLQLQTQLMKRNLSESTSKKDILTSFEIKQLSKWQIQSRVNHKLALQLDSHSLIQKYIDRNNQYEYAQQLQYQLLLMEQNQFNQDIEDLSSQS